VRGTVAGAAFALVVDPAATTCSMDATVPELPAGGLADDRYVEVKGTVAGSAITVSRVELKA
jgi:hypothetical protein